MKIKTLIDISLPLTEGMITYPGNPELEIEPENGETTFRSILRMGSHTGTHVDAPRHSFKTGKPLDKMPLERFVGPCRVLDMTHCRTAVTAADLKKAKVKKGERILVKTRNSRRGFKKFRNDYVFLDGDAADFLAKVGIALFGIDSLSVKEKGSKDVRGHESLLKKNIPILEGLDLSRARTGAYTLAALPLKFIGIDGAPVRAVLMK